MATDQSHPGLRQRAIASGRGAAVLVRIGAGLLVLIAELVHPAWSGELRLPAPALERDGRHDVSYQLAEPMTGRGTLAVRWTDAVGRLVEAGEIPVEVRNDARIVFAIDTRRAVAVHNQVTAHLTFDGTDQGGRAVHVEEEVSAPFAAIPLDPGWWDYQIIMWQDQSPRQYAALKALGITAGRIIPAKPGQSSAMSDDQQRRLLDADLHWYVENIATDFYSPYHRWLPGQRINQAYLEVRAAHRANPSALDPFKRQPSLSDPEWLGAIEERVARVVGQQEGFKPLFYSLADEPGIADLAAYWDFDLSGHSLDAMRRWLQEEYGTLAALNRQWGTEFASWDRVMPMLAPEAITQTDGNFSAWADFRAWMDVAFSRAVRRGTDAVHAVAPGALAAIEGGQAPGSGGYDYALLARAVDAFELYDSARNVDIVHSLNPKAPILTTSFAGGLAEEHRVWRELLHGGRGLILWDESSDYVHPDGSLGPRGQAAASYYAELRGGIGALLINSDPVPPQVAVLYSPPSQRTSWILEQQAAGEAGLERAFDADHPKDEYTRRLDLICRLLDEMGVPFRFVSPEQLEQGDLGLAGPGALILPRSLSLSPAEAGATRRLAGQGTLVVADDEPGTFDRHSRRLDRSPLAGLFAAPAVGGDVSASAGSGLAVRVPVDSGIDDDRSRLVAAAQPALAQSLSAQFRQHGLMPAFRVTTPSGEAANGVEVHLFRNGGVTLVGLLESAPAPVPAAPEGRVSRPVVLTLPAEAEAYDIRAGKVLGRVRQVTLELGPHEPALIAVSATPLPALVLSAPHQLRRGETGELRLGFAGPSPVATAIFRVEVTDPAGNLVRPYSGTRLGRDGQASSPLPIALNEAAGRWRIRAVDVVSRQQQDTLVEVLD